MSNLEALLEWQLKATALLDGWEREYRFSPARRWRFDFAHPELMLAVEVEGLSRGTSRHTTFEGYRRDCEKYNHAALAGWRVLRFTDREIRSGEARDFIETAIQLGDPYERPMNGGRMRDRPQGPDS